MNIFDKIKRNWLVLFIALAIGISVGFPEALFVFDLGEKYKGIPLMGTDAEEHYLASMREAYDGRYVLSNTYSIPKNIPLIYPQGGEATTGFISRISGLGVVRFNMLMKFLSPLLLFLLLYKLVLLIDGRKSVALLSASFIILASNLAARPNEILNFFTPGSGYHPGFNNYFRPINPEISSMMFFGYLVLFYKFIKNPKILFAVFMGFILGASFYFYLFTWTFLLVLTGLFLVFSVVVKKYELAKKISLALATALFLSLPYWLEVKRAVSFSDYQDAALRFGLETGRNFFFSGSLALLSAIMIFLFINYFRGIKKEASIFGAIFALSALIVYNQQIITGKSIQSPHYHFMSTVSMMIVFAVILAWTCFQKISIFKNNFLRALAVFFVLAMFFVNNFNWQILSYRHTKETAIKRQDYKPVINWLKQNTAEDDIIFSSAPLSALIPIFTPLNIYPSGFAQYYLLPKNVFKRETFLEIRFAGATSEKANERFLDDLRNKLSYGIYGIRYRKNMPDFEAEKLAEEYAAFYEKNLKETLGEDYYQPDYFIFDQRFKELALSEREIKDVMEQVADIDGRFLVYKMK